MDKPFSLEEYEIIQKINNILIKENQMLRQKNNNLKIVIEKLDKMILDFI